MDNNTFILTDGSVNRHGFRVITSGIDLTSFRENPVMLLMHNREILPIGRWDNIRIEGEKLLADAVFDQNDSLALRVEQKVKDKILKATSINVIPKKIVEQEDGIYAWVESEVLEASIVDYPSNKKALKLTSDNKNAIRLGILDDQPEEVEKVKALTKQLLSQNSTPKMKKVIEQLGLPQDSDETVVLAAVKALCELKAQHQELAMELGNATGLFKDSKIKEVWQQKLSAQPNVVGSALLLALQTNSVSLAGATESNTNPAVESLADALKKTQALAAEDSKLPQEFKGREGWNFDDWSKKDPKGLMKLKASQPDHYKHLYESKYAGVVNGSMKS